MIDIDFGHRDIRCVIWFIVLMKQHFFTFFLDFITCCNKFVKHTPHAVEHMSFLKVIPMKQFSSFLEPSLSFQTVFWLFLSLRRKVVSFMVMDRRKHLLYCYETSSSTRFKHLHDVILVPLWANAAPIWYTVFFFISNFSVSMRFKVLFAHFQTTIIQYRLVYFNIK